MLRNANEDEREDGVFGFFSKNAFGVFDRTRRRVRSLREMVAKRADEEECQGDEEGRGKEQENAGKEEEKQRSGDGGGGSENRIRNRSIAFGA